MIVVDVNILAYRWLDARYDTRIDALIRHDPIWAAPLLWQSEFRNILAAYLRRGKLDVAHALEVMTKAEKSLHGGQHAVESSRVLQLVSASRCTAYDCEYVALAETRETTLITEDKALLAAFPTRCRNLATFD